jgi:hypothetical protein
MSAHGASQIKKNNNKNKNKKKFAMITKNDFIRWFTFYHKI